MRAAPAGVGTPREGLDRSLLRRESTVSTIPPPERRHSIAELLRLLDELRRIAFDRSIDDADRARGIRDAIREHDGEFDDHDEE